MFAPAAATLHMWRYGDGEGNIIPGMGMDGQGILQAVGGGRAAGEGGGILQAAGGGGGRLQPAWVGGGGVRLQAA